MDSSTKGKEQNTMRFHIDTDLGDNYETFDTCGHEQTIKSAQKDAMKIAFSKGYTSERGYWLMDEFGTILEIVDPWNDAEWKGVA